MGLCHYLCSSAVNKTLKSYCKLKYLMSIIKKCPRLTKICSKEFLKCSLQHHPRKPRELKHHPSIRFYSTSSSRDEFKAEAPVGILGQTQDGHLSRLGGRLGQSFNLLSTHINMYFKRRNIAPAAKCASPELLQQASEAQRPPHFQTVITKCDMPQNRSKIQTNKDKLSSSIQENPDLQLFHTSSLTTRFGESYGYVAKHINSMFSRGGKVEMQNNLGSKGKIDIFVSKTLLQNAKSISQTTNGHNASTSSWEEIYTMFSTHINKYFGAKVIDKETTGEQTPLHPTSNHLPTKSIRSPPSEIKDGLDGLFHSSQNTVHFGESYSQMASHINQYFKDETKAVQNMDDDEAEEIDPQFTKSGKLKDVSLMDCLLHPTSAIPNFLNSYMRLGQTHGSNSNMASPRTTAWNKKQYFSQKRAEEATYNIIGTLKQTSSPENLASCVEALNEHLIRYPSCKMLLWQEKTAVLLLRKRRTYRNHKGLQSAIREILALVGYVDPVKGRGIRVLSIDGGGTRGVVPLQVLKLLEAETGKKIHQLFDYICGVSTGAVLAFMLGLARFSLEECEDMYQRFGSEVFRQNPFVGTVKMGWSHSYYNTETWESILKEKLGEQVLIKTARDVSSPKVSAVSAVVNWGTSPKAFVFRNYNHTPGSLSRYAGGSGYQMWQAVRASSAAPGYFQEFPLSGDIHQDGGIILNNPCALAVHESRLLWPNQPFQCVLSLGTGRYDNVKRSPATSTSLRAKISNLICSATDTEGVHTLLDDLLPPNVYFRFNPMLSTEVSLDESRPGALEMLGQDTKAYLERNRPKLARLCLVLGAERSAICKTMDWANERAWVMKQLWV